ncbi:hypothetical protein [Brevibacillus agri]|uniref:hypothetical protein n=1 Tax=Brevibacillus agri TaxID=51101 RepID=UPI0030F38B1D
MPSQARKVVSSSFGVAFTSDHNSPMLLASSTFFASPLTNSAAPSPNGPIVAMRATSCLAISPILSLAFWKRLAMQSLPT